MAVLRRYNQYQGLKELDVLIEDDAPVSIYFNIAEVPEVITQGRSSFLIGGSNLLTSNVEVKLEITNDDSGAVIYSEPVQGYLEGSSRRISIEVYDDNTLFGDCTLTVVGELNPETFTDTIPNEFVDTYNVRYTRKIYINGAGVNTQPILFYKQPNVHVSELIVPYITTTIPTASIEQKTGQVSGEPLPGTEGTTTNTTIQKPNSIFKKKKRSFFAKVFGGGSKNAFFGRSGRTVKRSSPEPDEFTITATDTTFDIRVVGGTLEVQNPEVDSSFTLESYHEVPTTYKSEIVKINNSTTIVPEKPFTITDTRFDEDSDERSVIAPLKTTSYTASFESAPTQSISTVNFRSFADLRISKLRTFSGDIHRVKVYARNKDAYGDFEMVADQQVESPELLFNRFSIDGNQRVGYFLNQSVINDNWQSSSNATITHDSELILDAAKISGSYSEYGQTAYFQSSNSAPINFRKDVVYELSARIVSRTGIKKDIDSNSSNSAKMAFFISGSAFDINHNLGASLGFQLTAGATSEPGFLNSNSGEEYETYDIVEETFTPIRAGNGVVQFGVFSGEWYISDVSIKPATDTGFSPDFIQVISPIPSFTQERPDEYEFVTEFLDVNNNTSQTMGFVSASTFVGGNSYIAGTDNVLSGSLFVGNATGSGIELAGVSSGFIRSVGYRGFESASGGTAAGGFMMYSGSVLDHITNEYSGGGVGLELVANTESFFRFSTNPQILDIRTDKFFIGRESSQFMSGSDSNIEISSSLFHLDPKNNSLVIGAAATINSSLSVNQLFAPAGTNAQTAKAAITAEGFARFVSASIGSFKVNNNALFAGSPGNPDFFISGSATGNEYFISSSNFNVKASGDVTASGLALTGGNVGGLNVSEGTVSVGEILKLKDTGDITGSAVLLGDKSISQYLQYKNNQLVVRGDVTVDSIRTPATIAGAPSTVLNASSSITSQGFARFVSASIGGFGVSTNQISSTNGSLILKSNGQISASAVSMSGAINASSGKIAGWTIIGNLLSGSNATLDAGGAALYKSDQGPDSDSSAGYDQLRDEYYIDFTPEDQGNTTNFYVKFGPNFSIDSTGTLFASGAKFEGTISASKGIIGGFTTDNNAMHSDTIFISGSPLQGGIDDPRYMFISTSNFNVKENGDLTGSRVLIEGGTIASDVQILGTIAANSIRTPATIAGSTSTVLNASSSITAQGFARFVSASIGGFHVSDSQINDTSNNLVMKSSGQITGSQVLFDGGTIGGFTIDADEIKSGTNIGLNSATKAITINNTTFGNQGIQLEYNSGTPRFYVGDGTNEFLKFDGSSIDIRTKKAFISGSQITLKSPDFFLGDTNNFISGSGGQLAIQALGTTTISGSAVNIQTPKFFMGGSSQFISGSNGNIEISSSKFHLDSGGNVTMAGAVTATTGTIGGFTIGTDLTSTAGTLILKGSSGQITGSDVLFNGGKVGGWTIGATTLTGGVVTLNSAGSIEVGGLGDATTTATTNSGFFADSSGNVLIKGNVSGNDYLKISAGGGIDIKSQTFDLATSTMILDSGTNSGTVLLGNSAASISHGNTGIYLDGTGKFSFVEDSQNFIKGGNSNFEIASENFSLSGSTTLAIDTSKIRLGTNATSTLSHGSTGIYFDNTGKFSFVEDSSNFIKGGNSNFEIQAENFHLLTSTLRVSSSAGGSIALGTTPPSNLSSNGIFLSGSGHFNLQEDSNNYVRLDSSGLQLKANDGFQLSSTDGNKDLLLTTTKFLLDNSVVAAVNVDKTTGTGVYMDNTGNFRVGSGTEYLRFDTSNGLDIATDTINIDTSTLDINTSNGGTISLGTGTPSLSAAGIFLTGSGEFNLQVDSNNFLRQSGGTFTIKSSTFSLTGTNLELSNNKFNMGTLSSATDTADSSTGFHVDSSGNVLIKQGGANAEYLKFAGGGLDIKAGTFDLATSTMILDSGTNSGKIALGSTPPTAYNSGNGFYVDGTGKLLVGSGSGKRIQFDGSDFTVQVGNLELDATDLEISSTNKYFKLGHDAGNGRVEMYGGSTSTIMLGRGSSALTMSADGSDTFLQMGSKTGFNQTTTQGMILGLDGGVPRFDMTSGSLNNNYFRFDGSGNGGLDIKTTNFVLDTTYLDINSSTKRIEVSDGSNTRVRIGEVDSTAADKFGLVIFDGTGTAYSDEIVHFSEARNQIASWSLSPTQITSNNLVIDSSGTLQTSDFASGVKGWRITSANNGEAEFEKVTIRGTLSTTVFEKESVNAVGGQLYVANSTIITSSAQISATEKTMSVANVSGFTSGEILSAKKVTDTGFQTEYFYVNSASRNTPSSDKDLSGRIYVTRGYGSGISGESGSLGDIPSSATTYENGQVIVSTGKVGTGYIRLNANPNDTTTPYMDIVERTGSGIYDISLKARLGDLSGLSSGLLYGNSDPGFGLFTENVFLQGAITAQTGSITGILHVRTDVNNQIKIGTNVQSTNDGIYVNNNNYWYTDGAFKVGGGTYGITNDSSGNIGITANDFSLTAGTTLILNSSTPKLVMGANASSITATSNEGVYIDGSGNFRVGEDSVSGDNFIHFNATGNSLTMKSTNFNLASTNLLVSTSSMYLGTITSAADSSGAGFYADNSGNFRVYGDADNFISVGGGNMTLKSEAFDLQSTNLLIDTSQIYLGTITSNSDSSGAGFFADNSGNVRIFADSDNFLTFGSSTLDIKTQKAHISGSQVLLKTPNFYLGDNDVFVSGSGGKIAIGASNFSVDKDGNLTVGNTDNEHIAIDNGSDLLFKNGGTTMAELDGTTWTLGGATGTTTNALRISTAGIGIYDSATNYASMSGDGLEVYQSGVSVASFGSTARIGQSGAESVTVGSDAIVLDGSDGTARVQITSDPKVIIGKADDNRIEITDSAFSLYEGTAEKISIGSSAVQVKYDASNYSQMTSTNFEVYQGGQKSASFGTSTTIGPTAGKHTLIDSSGVQLKVGSTVYGKFAETVTVGPTSAIYSEISAGSFAIKDSSRTYLSASAQGLFTSGSIHANKGVIGGFAIDGTRLKQGSSFYLDGDPSGDYFIYSSKFNVTPSGEVSASSIHISGSDVTLASDKVVIKSAGNFELNTLGNADSSNKGFIQLGGATLTNNTKGVFMDEDGNVAIKDGEGGEIKVTSPISIKSKNIDIVTDKFKLVSSVSVPSMSLGPTPPTAYNSGNGFFVDGSGKFLVGSGSGDRIQFDGSNFVVEAGNFSLDSSGNVTANGTTHQFGGTITANVINATGSGVIGGFTLSSDEIRHSGNALRLKSSGQITGSNVLFSGGKVGGWTLSGTTIANGTDIILDSSNKRISINNATFGNDGLQMEHTTGGAKFYVGDGANKHIKFDGTDVDIKSDSFILEAGNLDIDSSTEQIRLGSATTFGSGTGILMGKDGSDYEFYVGNGTQKIHWDGSNLNIAGNITLTNSSEFVQSSDTGSMLADATSSLVEASETGSMLDPFTQNSATGSLVNPTTFTPTTAAGTSDGLHLGSDKMGFVSSGTYKTYMDNSGNFYLGGTSGALTWTNNTDTLNITGNITISNPNAQPFTNNASTASMLADATASLVETSDTGSMLDPFTQNSATGSLENLSSQNNPTNYAFGGDGFDLTTNTAASGLNLTSAFMGYHDGSGFKTYLDSSGNFYLGGNSTGAFMWNNSTGVLGVSGSGVVLETPQFFLGKIGSQFISGSGGAIEISSSKFHLKSDGDIIVRKVSADDGTIGGFTIDEDEIKATNFSLKTETVGGSRIKLGSVASVTDTNRTTIGTFLSSSGEFLLKSGNTAGANFIQGAGNNLVISSSNLSVAADGNVTMAGNITATGGSIADYEIQSGELLNSQATEGYPIAAQTTVTSMSFQSGTAASMLLSLKQSTRQGYVDAADTLHQNTFYKIQNSGKAFKTEWVQQPQSDATEFVRSQIELGADIKGGASSGVSQDWTYQNAFDDGLHERIEISALSGSLDYGGGGARGAKLVYATGSNYTTRVQIGQFTDPYLSSNTRGISLERASVLQLTTLDTDFEESLTDGLAGRLRVVLNGIGSAHGKTVAASFINHSLGFSPTPNSVTNNQHVGGYFSARSAANEAAIAIMAGGDGGGAGYEYSFWGFEGQLYNEDDIKTDADIIVGGTVDGRDLQTDGTKLDGIEASADVTDATNVAAAGALMDSELSDITAVKGINQDLTTTSAVSFATVNTGQGANELYDMDQNVKTTSSPTFNDVTVSDELKVNDYARIDALRVGTTNTDPGDGNLYVENDLTVAGKIFQGTSDTVYFEAQCTGGTSVANATYTKVEYNSEAVDLGGDYSTTYDRFTAPVNGVYFFRAQFLWSNASNWDSGDNPIIGFSVNDVDASDGRFMIRTGNFTEYFSMQTTAIIKLDASDTVHVDAYQNTGTTLYIYDGGGEGSYNQFMGTLIHALT